MKGIQVRWPRKPWNMASPSGPATRKYSIEMVADIHFEVRRCTVLLYPHPLTNSQGSAALWQISLMCFEYHHRQLQFWQLIPYPFLLGSQTQVNLDIPVEIMKGIQVKWPRRPWNRASPSFQRPGNTVEMGIELVARIVAAYDIIQNTSGIFVRVRQKLVRRCHVCIEVSGLQFEQLL